MDGLDGVDELSSNIPSWFHPAYFTLIFFIALLATIVKAGPVYRTAQNSAVSLVLIDSFTIAIVALTATLLFLAIVFGHPWREISYTSIAPLAMFLLALVFASVSNVRRRGFLNLWSRLACVACVTDVWLDESVFIRLTKLFLQECTDEHELDVFDLLRADTLGGISAAPYTKGSSWPFWSAFKMWWRQGTPERIPHILVLRQKNGIPRPVRIRRHLHHSAALQALMCVAEKRLEQEDYRVPVTFVNLRVVTSFDRSVRTVMHERFGFIWHRVAESSCISRDEEAWWFVGAEVVQTLKAICGVKFISGKNYCNDVTAAWEWAATFYDWRKPFQVGPVAFELARSHMEDPNMVVDYGLGLAGEGKNYNVPTEAELYLAIEANVVACLGLAVSAHYANMEKRVPTFVNSYVEILERQEDAIIGPDCSGSSAIIAIPSDLWPERELATMIVEWILAACDYEVAPYSGIGSNSAPASAHRFARFLPTD